MESVEVVAKSVEDAIQQALAKLGKSRDEVEITVLSEGHKGLLGFVRGENARVRVKVREETQPSPETPPIKSGIVVAVAEELLAQLLDKMGIEADVNAKEDMGDEQTPILLEVTGDDLGILIGRRGETLSALQFLLNLMVGKQLNSWVRIVIDVEGYRSRREESLRSLASRVAERVRRTGQAIALDPMPANERRIVHLALQGNPYVTTESHGFGEDRRVSVIPKSRR
ncbi:MAG: RNA-binding cell elongation regulator Jag/EloR [Chloroflexota bacterium]|jgi:spoIIIJ-associated protein